MTELIEMLIRLDETDWRSLRAEVRWRYERGERTPPRRLTRYMKMLPDDARVWHELADEAQTLRRSRARTKRTELKRLNKKKARDSRKDYIRNYMRRYRALKKVK